VHFHVFCPFFSHDKRSSLNTYKKKLFSEVKSNTAFELKEKLKSITRKTTAATIGERFAKIKHLYKIVLRCEVIF
jgi:hypothetical protein